MLEIRELPDPVPDQDEVLIRVRAFGLNHADAYMRSGVWAFGIPVLGIEAAGTVERDPSGRLATGTKVIAIVGGMARDRNGSYAELVSVPATNVVPVRTKLSWPALAAIPEVYATAWTALHGNLAIAPEENVLIRGATSSVGQAAVNLAADHGARVIATTRDEARAARLRELGADEVLIDDGALASQVRRTHPEGADAVLDLIGNSVLRDSLRSVREKGRVCQVGFLGGLEPVVDFNPLADLPSGVQLSIFASAFVLGDEHFPTTDVPFQQIIDKADQGVFAAKPARVFGFDQIVEAHRIMDSGQAGGKLVVELGERR
jgi:NADPH2:quinone reductase